MAWVWADRVLDTSTTTGTGALTVSGTSPAGWRTFSTVCAVADTFYYTITDPVTGAWETGEGSYSALNTVTRTAVRASSNADALVSFAANTKNVFIDVIGYWFGTQLPSEITVAAGAVAYGDASGTTGVTGDLTNFAWDATNKRLGIGTNAPAVPLDVRGAATFTGTVTGVAATLSGVVTGASARFDGGVGIGAAVASTYSIYAARNLTAATSYNIRSNPTYQDTVITAASGFYHATNTAALAFTLGTAYGYRSEQGTIGAGSAITNQYAFYAGATNIGATGLNIGYGSLIPTSVTAATNWNIYASGTANNYMAGALGIGSTTLAGVTLRLSKTLTGAVSSYGLYNNGIVQSDATTAVSYSYTSMSTAAAAFTTGGLYGNRVEQGTIGAGSTVTSQWGFYAGATLIGATNNYGFNSSIPAGAGRWNFYAAGTAANYFAGATDLAGGATTTTATPGTNTTAVATTAFVTAAVAAGPILQTVSFQTGALATGTTLTPLDDTIPQITEGTEFMTLAITPKSATSNLIIEAVVNGACGAATTVTTALHQDAIANALAVSAVVPSATANMMQIVLKHTVVSGSLTARTYRIRVGPNSASTFSFNGSASVRVYGGVMASSIVIQEVL